MSFRNALARNITSLQPEYVRTAPVGGRDAVFRFSVPVLRVRDVAATVAWYKRHLGFAAEAFPERAPHEFAILERDGVQLLVRTAGGASRSKNDGHSGWDLEASMALSGEIVRPLSPMGNSMAELEVRDPDGYVLCIGGPTQAAFTQT